MSSRGETDRLLFQPERHLHMKHVGRRSLRHTLIDLLTFVGARNNPTGRHLAVPTYGYAAVVDLSPAEAAELAIDVDERVAA
jgi:hypothetical protein